MLVFLDESGDTGLKIEKGSSAIFIIVLVIFEDEEEAVSADKAIQKLRQSLGFSDAHEFHFTSTKPGIKKKFFETIARHNFTYHGVVIQKDLLSEDLFNARDDFYRYVSHMVFQNAKPYLHKAKVVLDKRGERSFTQTFGTYLKKKMNQERECIRKVVSQDSRCNNLIQLADMICGALKRCYSATRRDTCYKSMISHLEMSLQIWPRKE